MGIGFEDAIERVFKQLRRHKAALWTGAGFSLSAGLPTSNELSCILSEKYCIDDSICGLVNITQAIIYRDDNVDTNKNELIGFVKELFDKRVTDSTNHEMVFRIPYFKTIITSNYDNLFEKYYGSNLAVAFNQESLVKIDTCPEKVKLYKIHGDINHPDSVIITKDDYTKFNAGLNDNLMLNSIKDIFATRSMLFIGYSMDDVNIAPIWMKINQLVSEYRDFEHFLVAPCVSDEKIREFERVGFTYIDSTAENILTRLLELCKETMILDIALGNSLNDIMREKHERALRVKSAMQGELEKLPKGYISKKQIRGKSAYYLQWREKDKVKSRYIPIAEHPAMKKQVDRRKQLEQSIRAVNENIKRIEKVLQ